MKKYKNQLFALVVMASAFISGVFFNLWIGVTSKEQPRSIEEAKPIYVDGAKFLAKTALFDSVVSVMKMSYVSKHKTTNSQILDSAIDYLSSDLGFKVAVEGELLVVQSPKNRRYSVNIPSNLTHDGLVKALVHLSLITAAYKSKLGWMKGKMQMLTQECIYQWLLKEYDPYETAYPG